MPRLLVVLVSSVLLLASSAPAGSSAAPIRIAADPGGAMKFDRSTLRAKPGRVTIAMRNPASAPHNVAIRGKGVKKLGPVVLKGGTSTVSATLKAGTYLFYCSVPGHEQAGMKGVLTVR